MVILPKEDTNEIELRERGITHRGPLNPPTGGRVKEISAAAASAASHLLDRVRKGNEVRLNKKRKYLPYSGQNQIAIDASKTIRHSHAMAPTSQSYHMRPSVSTKDERKESQLSRLSKTKIHTSLASQLSLDPSIEGTKLNGNESAATHALMRSDLGTSMIMKNGKLTLNQQRFIHPFPSSKGARSMSLGQSYERCTDLGALQNLALPPLSTQESSVNKRSKVDKEKPNDENATFIVTNILRQFVDEESKVVSRSEED